MIYDLGKNIDIYNQAGFYALYFYWYILHFIFSIENQVFAIS